MKNFQGWNRPVREILEIECTLQNTALKRLPNPPGHWTGTLTGSTNAKKYILMIFFYPGLVWCDGNKIDQIGKSEKIRFVKAHWTLLSTIGMSRSL